MKIGALVRRSPGDRHRRQLADDPKLRIEVVDSVPAGMEVIELKPERVQEPETAFVEPARKRR